MREASALIADEPAQPGDNPGLAGWMQRLCRAAMQELSASGAGVSVMSQRGVVTVLGTSSPASEAVEQLPFTLGEGPCLDAYSSGRPVLIPHLREAASSRWLGYGPAALAQGVRAVFAFPLQVGAARLGAMTVYRDQAGPLSARLLMQALAFADAAMTGVLDAQARTDADGPSVLESTMEGSFLVYQAQGMVKVQLDVSLAEALVRLRAYAYAHDRPLNEVAADVVARRVTFEPGG